MEKKVSWCRPDSEDADNNAQETPEKAAPEEKKQEPQPPKPSPAFACLQTSDGPIFVRKSSVVIFRLLDTNSNVSESYRKKSTVPITIVNGHGGLSSFDYHINDKSQFDKVVEEMNS